MFEVYIMKGLQSFVEGKDSIAGADDGRPAEVAARRRSALVPGSPRGV